MLGLNILARFCRLPVPSLPRPKDMMLLKDTDVYTAPESKPLPREQSSRKRIAPQAEHEDAPPTRRVRVSDEDVESAAYWRWTNNAERKRVKELETQLEREKKRAEEKEAKRAELQHALAKKEEERAESERDDASKGVRPSVPAEGNATELLTKEKEYDESRKTHQKEQQALLARLQDAESSANEWKRRFEEEQQHRATEQEHEEKSASHQKEEQNMLARLQAAESNANEWKRRLEEEQQHRATEQEQWQAQQLQADAQYTHELGMEREGRAQDQQQWNMMARTAEQKYSDLEKELDASEAARGEDQRKAGEVLNSTTASVQQQCEAQLQQERRAKIEAEQGRRDAIATQAPLSSRIADLESEATVQETRWQSLQMLYSKACKLYNNALAVHAGHLTERFNLNRAVTQAQRERDSAQGQLCDATKALAKNQQDFQNINKHHETMQHLSATAADRHRAMMNTESNAKLKYKERAETAEALVKQYQRGGATLPRPKAKAKPAQTEDYIGFGDEEMKDGEDDDDDDDDFVEEVPRHALPATSSSASQVCGSGNFDDDDLPNDSEFDEAFQLWNENRLSALILKKNLLQRFLPSSTGTFIYLSPCRDHIIKVHPRRADMMPNRPGNTILSGSIYLAGHDLEEMTPEKRKFKIEEFEKQVVFACLLPTQIAAAQMITEEEGIAEDLCSDGALQMPPVMVRKAAGKFINQMNELNKNSLLNMVDERHENCCFELRQHPKIFKGAAQQLAKTAEFVRTITAIVDGHITKLEPGMGVWPAEVADHVAASRSLNASTPVVEKKARMGAPQLPVKATSESDNDMAKVLEDLGVEPDDSVEGLMKLAKHAKIDHKRLERKLPSQKDGPMKARTGGVVKKKDDRSGIGGTRGGKKGAESMFKLPPPTPPQTPPENARTTPEAGQEDSSHGSSSEKSEKKADCKHNPFVDDDDEDKEM